MNEETCHNMSNQTTKMDVISSTWLVLSLSMVLTIATVQTDNNYINSIITLSV